MTKNITGYILEVYAFSISGGCMTKAISLKLNDEVYEEIEEILKTMHVSRNSYINEALAHYNRENKRKLLKRQLEFESKLVRENSMSVLRDFENMEEPPVE